MHFRFILNKHLSKTDAGIGTPDNAKGDTDAKSVFLCHAIAQPYVAHSYEINGSAGWAAERQAGSLCAGSSNPVSATAIEIGTSRGSSLN